MLAVITTHTPPPVQATVQDITAQAHTWGFEDALAGMDQRGSQFFLIGSPAWDAYNTGFAEGNQMVYSLTGIQRFVFIPQEN